jgi:urease beta subunit
MLNTKQVAVGTTAVEIIGRNQNPVQVLLHNAVKSSNEYIWFGGSNAVTTSTGAHLDNAATYQIVLQPGNELWAITNAGTKELHVMWQVL